MKKLVSVRTVTLAGSLLLQLSALCFHSRGAAGDVDLSFDPGSGVNGTVNAIAVQADGKVLIVGDFTTVKGLARAGIARLNGDGSGDPGFDAGREIAPAGYGSAYAVVLQPDGKVLVGLSYSIVRLRSDGSFDSTFNYYPVGSNYFQTTAFALQSDGKVLVSGSTVTVTIDPEGYVDSSYSPLVTRVRADGSRDTNFSNSGLAAISLVLQPDGKVLVGSASGVVRFNANGSGDSSFNPAANGIVRSVVVQSDGKVIIAGRYIGNGTNRHSITRLNADGSVDANFNPGTVMNGDDPSVEALAVQSDGKVLIVGGFTTVNGTNRNGIARLNANGSLDSSFNPGTGADRPIHSLSLQPDGKMFVGGAFTRFNGVVRSRITRLNADGSLDGGFSAGSGEKSPVDSVVVQPDGKTLMAGGFSMIQDINRSGVARLNLDGSVDSTFNPGTGAQLDPYWDGAGVPQCTIALQSDGKVLIGGPLLSFDGTPVNGIARLHPDGTLDGTFNASIVSGDIETSSSLVTPIAVQADGKVLIGGVFLAGTGTNVQFGIARLNANGSLDGSFNAGGAADLVYAIVLQPDGKVLLGGWFTINGNRRNGVFRLNSDGSVDSGFNAAETFGYITSVALQANGKVLVGGAFSAVNGTNRTAIARLNANGILDQTFNPNIAADSVDYPIVKTMVVRPDGKVLIGGVFSTINGANRNGIARLNANGSADGGFNSGEGTAGGTYSAVNSIAVQPNGNVIMGGDFTTINGVVRPLVARLYGDAFVLPSLNIARFNAFVMVSWPASAAGYQLQQTTNLSQALSWTSAAQPSLTNGGLISVTVPATIGNKFFRLKSP